MSDSIVTSPFLAADTADAGGGLDVAPIDVETGVGLPRMAEEGNKHPRTTVPTVKRRGSLGEGKDTISYQIPSERTLSFSPVHAASAAATGHRLSSRRIEGAKGVVGRLTSRTRGRNQASCGVIAVGDGGPPPSRAWNLSNFH